MTKTFEHVRFHIERGAIYGKQGKKTVCFQWVRETIAGQKTIAGARREMKQLKEECPSYYKDWRIVKRTVTEEVVT